METSTIGILKSLFRKDLNRLKRELNQYKEEANLWIIDKEIANSGGNLALHLIGNLKHFVGTILGDTGYVRRRADEFALKNVPREQLLREIEETIEVIDQTLDRLDQAQLEAEYPVQVFKEPLSTAHFLTHLAVHLGYHLGQVNYHRRLLDH